MAELGFRTMNELIGRVDCLNVERAVTHWKAKGLDLQPLLHQPKLPASVARRRVRDQEHGLEVALDNELIERCRPALDSRAPVEFTIPNRHIDWIVGAILGNAV